MSYYHQQNPREIARGTLDKSREWEMEL